MDIVDEGCKIGSFENRIILQIIQVKSVSSVQDFGQFEIGCAFTPAHSIFRHMILHYSGFHNERRQLKNNLCIFHLLRIRPCDLPEFGINYGNINAYRFCWALWMGDRLSAQDNTTRGNVCLHSCCKGDLKPRSQCSRRTRDRALQTALQKLCTLALNPKYIYIVLSQVKNVEANNLNAFRLWTIFGRSSV